jgi:SNF2 family DNA or RNA helicase
MTDQFCTIVTFFDASNLTYRQLTEHDNLTYNINYDSYNNNVIIKFKTNMATIPVGRINQFPLLRYMIAHFKDFPELKLCITLNTQDNNLCYVRIRLKINKHKLIEFASLNTLDLPFYFALNFNWMEDIFNEYAKNQHSTTNTKKSSKKTKTTFKLNVALVPPETELNFTQYDNLMVKSPYSYQQANVDWMINLTQTHTNNSYELYDLSGYYINPNISGIYYHPETYRMYTEDQLTQNCMEKLTLKGGLICDRTGLGKTITVIALIISLLPRKIIKIPTSKLTLKLKQMHGQLPPPTPAPASTVTNIPPPVPVPISPSTSTVTPPETSANPQGGTLIIVPKRIFSTWISRFDEFVKPSAQLKLIKLDTMVDVKRLTSEQLSSADVVILNMTLMINPNFMHTSDKSHPDLTKILWNRVIVDEIHDIIAHYLTSKKQDDVALVRELFRYHGLAKFALTATPILDNKPRESLEFILKYLSNLSPSKSALKAKSSRRRHYDSDSDSDDGYAGYNDDNDGKGELYLTSRLRPEQLQQIYAKHFRLNTEDSVKHIAKFPTYQMQTIFTELTPIERQIYQQAVQSNSDDSELVQICTNFMISNKHVGIIGSDVRDLATVNEQMIKHYTQQLHELSASLPMYQTRLQTEHNKFNLMKFTNLDDQKREYANYRSRINRIEVNLLRIPNEIQQTQAAINAFNQLDLSKFSHEVCALCGELPREIAFQPNGHHFCGDCIHALIPNGATTYTCPISQIMIHKSTVTFSINPHHPNNQNKTQIPTQSTQQTQLLTITPTQHDTGITNRYGAKMSVLISYLRQIIKNDADAKIIIFSQWDQMLKLVGEVLTGNRIQYAELIGSSIHIRSQLQKFTHEPECRVILLSAEKSSSGNDLAVASYIVLLDTINHPNCDKIETQARGRAVRLGQKRDVVEVTRLVSKKTIEEDNYLTYLRNNKNQPDPIILADY